MDFNITDDVDDDFNISDADFDVTGAEVTASSSINTPINEVLYFSLNSYRSSSRSRSVHTCAVYIFW